MYGTTNRLTAVNADHVRPERHRPGLAGVVHRSLIAIGMCGAVAAGMITLTEPALAAACGEVRNVSVPGGEGHWTVNCFGATTRVSGYVKDTREDGKCAQVKVVYQAGTQTSPRACPKGTKQTFDISGTGRADVYLRTI